MKEEKIKKKRYLPLLILLGGVGILALAAKATPTIKPTSSKYNVSLKSMKKNNPTYFTNLGFCVQDAKLNGSITGFVPNVVGNELTITGTFNGVLINSQTYNAGDVVNKPLFDPDVEFKNNTDNLLISFLENGTEVLSLEYEAGCTNMMQAGNFLI